MKKIERRINARADVKLETRADGQPPVITGMGAVTYDGTPATEYVLWDFDSERCVERILPGAFDKALARPDDVRGLFNHDANQVLGRTTAGTMRLAATSAGLAYEITPGNTTVAADVKEHLRRKDVSGSSIAFSVDEERWTETKSADGKWNVLREIISVGLADTGPVTFPAYETTTAGLRADGEPDEAKRSLAAFRAKGKGNDTPAAPTTDDVKSAAAKVTAACAAFVKLGVTDPANLDIDAKTALAAMDLALDEADAIVDLLIGEDDEDDDAGGGGGAVAVGAGDEAYADANRAARLLIEELA